MPSSSLHPLARQAIILSGRSDSYGWAFGLTKYLAYGDPLGCVRWTLDFVMARNHDTAEYADVVRRAVELLGEVLAEPSKASLTEMEQFVWLPWSCRFGTKRAGPLARLIWAAMGAVELSRPRAASASELPGLFHSDEDPKTLAEKVVHDQCATAIHMLANDDPDIPAAAAKVFTMTVCRAEAPAAPTVLRRFEWSWQGLSFDIAVLHSDDDAFYLQFIDRQGEEPLYAGPFPAMGEVDGRLDLLKHQPVSIRFKRIQ